MKELALIIPVYNEEANIKKVINDWKNILNKNYFDIIIINDGSTDNTNIILKKLKSKITNLKILNKLNGGHGETIYFGYVYSLKNKYKFIFQVDSDDQFSHRDFKKIWKLRNNGYDLILGSRYNRKDPIIRIFLSKIILKIFFLFYFNRNIADANIPFRLIKNRFLNEFIQISSKKYIAPNILMTLFAKKTLFVKVNHFQRSKGNVNWPIKKLLNFGIKLIFEIIQWKKLITKRSKADLNYFK